jgi:hypothetical protein
MNNSKWLRLAAVASAAGALVTASSIASAQYNPKRAYCREYALNACSTDPNGYPTTPTLECYEAQFAWCMSDFARLDLRKPGDYDKRAG